MNRNLTRFGAIVLVLLPAVFSSLPAVSQDAFVRRNGVTLYYRSYFSPATIASLQIQAESQYFRDIAEARVRHAEAHRLENDNRVQDTLNAIKIRELKKADRDQRILEQIAKRDENKQKTWERLQRNPELTAGEILTGKALNFLKDRLKTKLIGYSGAREVEGRLKLTPELIHALQVRQVLGRGESLIFRLDEARPIQVDWWPPGLRVPELKSERADFVKARSEVFEAKTDEMFDAKIKKLLLAHENLEVEFLMLKSHAERVKTQHSIHEFMDGKAFLRSLMNEIHRLEKTGRGQTASHDLSFKGHDLTELLSHLIRNGLEFAPPRPGDEPAYQQVFEMLKNLCIATEIEDAQTATANKK